MIIGTLSLPAIAIRAFDPGSYASKIASHDVIEGKPKKQWIGEESRQPTMSLMLHRDFIDPVATFDALNEMRAGREIIALLEDDGTVLGTFLIVSVKPSQQRKMADGYIIAQQVDVAFDEPGLDSAIVPRPDPIAVKGANTPTTTDGPPEDVTRPKDDISPAEIARQ